MISRTALLSLGAAMLLLAPNIVIAEEAQTLKERLSDKATDAQRVNNCRVPAERRGEVPRPDCLAQPRGTEPAADTGPAMPREREPR